MKLSCISVASPLLLTVLGALSCGAFTAPAAPKLFTIAKESTTSLGSSTSNLYNIERYRGVGYGGGYGGNDYYNNNGGGLLYNNGYQNYSYGNSYQPYGMGGGYGSRHNEAFIDNNSAYSTSTSLLARSNYGGYGNGYSNYGGYGSNYGGYGGYGSNYGGYGSGYGSGYGGGYGMSQYGSGFGNGYGSSYGSGYGMGYGSQYGSGYGSSYGGGYGSGYGSNNYAYNGMMRANSPDLVDKAPSLLNQADDMGYHGNFGETRNAFARQANRDSYYGGGYGGYGGYGGGYGMGMGGGGGYGSYWSGNDRYQNTGYNY